MSRRLNLSNGLLRKCLCDVSGKRVDVQLVGDMVVTCLDVVKVNIVERVDVELVEWTVKSS